MMTPSLTPELAAALIAPLAVGAGAWAIKRWIVKVDTRLEAMSSQMGDLRLKAAVAEERFSGLLGALDEFRRTALQTTKDIGRLSGAVEKFWAVLQAKGLVDSRMSDQVLDRTGSGK